LSPTRRNGILPVQHNTWIGVACRVGANYNAGSVFNVYHAHNGCSVRVWLHQYTNWYNNGWSHCISPGAY
jgi:hypothetical protein